MTKETLLNFLAEVKKLEITETEFCKKHGLPKKCLYYWKRKYNIFLYDRGKHPNSKKTRNYLINDDSFSKLTLESCYWAGFIAADGNINKKERELRIGLAEKDMGHLMKLKNFLQCENPISHVVTNKGFPTCYLSITSPKICQDLCKHFNIIPQKSLNLKPPNITQPEFIDAFIVGYIDGDGSIGLYNSKQQKALQIQILGTENMIDWILKRFLEVCGKNSNKYKNHLNNTWTIMISDRKARTIFCHYYNIEVPKLKRKWNEAYYNHASTYKKYRNLEKYKLILSLEKQGITIYEIAKQLNVTYQAILWYKKQTMYLTLQKESADLDKGEVDLETES